MKERLLIFFSLFVAASGICLSFAFSTGSLVAAQHRSTAPLQDGFSPVNFGNFFSIQQNAATRPAFKHQKTEFARHDIEERSFAPGPFPRAGGAGAARPSLEQMIGQMLLVGFTGTKPTDKHAKALADQLASGEVGGVIFMSWNIRSKSQVKELTSYFQRAARKIPAFVAVDQEGGSVQRLSRARGYTTIPSARAVGRRSPDQALDIYRIMASELRESGFNLNFGPVVDLDLYRRNPIIGRKYRSYGAKPDKVSTYAKSFVTAHRDEGVLTSLKHFPGHGSSRTDSHRRLVDLSKSWKPIELSPYKTLLAEGLVDSVMVGHLYHPEIVGPVKYPATLSGRAVKKVLRKELSYKGVVITDDLEMGAITRNYSFEESLIMAINAGNDVLLLSNRRWRDPHLARKTIEVIMKAVRSGRIRKSSIRRAYSRIIALKRRLDQRMAFQPGLRTQTLVTGAAH